MLRAIPALAEERCAAFPVPAHGMRIGPGGHPWPFRRALAAVVEIRGRILQSRP